MVNNFELIKNYLEFQNERSFYFIQILKRKKENPEMNAYSIPIESFYVFSIEQYEKLEKRIIELCNMHNARAYIKMNCLDAQSVMLEQISLITQEIRKGNWKHMSKSLNSACGVCGKQDGNDKLYLVDLDGIDIGSDDYNDVVSTINNLQPTYVLRKVRMSVPTKNGCHLLTTGFDMNEFRKTFKSIDIHSDGITLLYVQ